jgi:hypothetical protein
MSSSPAASLTRSQGFLKSVMCDPFFLPGKM